MNRLRGVDRRDARALTLEGLESRSICRECLPTADRVLCGDPQIFVFPADRGSIAEPIFRSEKLELDVAHHGSLAVVVPGMHADLGNSMINHHN